MKTKLEILKTKLELIDNELLSLAIKTPSIMAHFSDFDELHSKLEKVIHEIEEML